MRKFHFFQAKSRLGLKNVPYGSDSNSLNIGVENGPGGILNDLFLDDIWNHSFDEFTFSKPEEIEENYFKVLSKEYNDFSNFITERLSNEEIQFVIGGDHSVSYSSLLALSKRIDLDKVLHIQIDSHTDIHLERTSPSGNFHGMWLRPFITEFDNDLINNQVTSKLNPNNIIFIGNIIFEEEEERLIKEKEIEIISQNEIETKKSIIIKKIDKCEHLHLSIDIDAFHKDIAPATGIPAEDGLYLDNVIDVFDIVKHKNNLSIDLVEVNPEKIGANKTLELARNLIKRLVL